jgi:hypothetical protein
MSEWRLALDRLVDALENEILAAPEPEVHTVVVGSRTNTNSCLHLLRSLVASSVEQGEESAALLPETNRSLPTLRRI